MLAMSKGALSAAQAETYYEEKYSQDDYYTERQRVVGQWFGRGAEQLDLSGEVAPRDFQSVLRGLRPSSGEVLVQKATGYDERRAGWDATFNAPKSISIESLVGENSRLIHAHRSAVTRALAELEQYALSRRRGGSEWVATGNMVAARFDHIAARPAREVDDGYGPDPHLHTHVVIANMTRRPDGEWRGLDPIEIYRAQSFATAVYRSELAREVQALGYEIEITARDGRWELKGYTREQVMAFSRRRQDIEEALARSQLSGAEAAQIIAHKSRLSKDHRDAESLKGEWRKRAREYGISFALSRTTSRAISERDGHTAEEALRQSIAENAEREAVIDRRLLEASALQHAMGRVGVDQIRQQTRAFEHDGRVILAGHAFNSPQGAYTTPEMVAVESENVALMIDGEGTTSPLASADQIRTWASRRGLAPDQSTVAEATLTSGDWLTSIEGRAGAAKTTTVGAIREFAEEKGYSVRGFAPTTRAVKSLKEAHVSATTLGSLLESQERHRSANEIWIVDESSLLPTRQVNRLLHKARDQRVERIIFVGDQRQHHAIEAGRPVYQMQQAGMTVARLETIRRQRHPELRLAVTNAARGEISEALAILERRGDIREITDLAERRKQIAGEYLATRESGAQVLVISPANRERRELNQAIRNELISHRIVAANGQPHAILVDRGLSGAERAMARNYEEGDVIRYVRGSKQYNLGKGDYARVASVDREENLISIRTAHGDLVRYNPVRLFGVEVFREEHRILAGGDRIQFRAPNRALGIANGEFATITEIGDRQLAFRLDNGKVLKASFDQVRHIDYGYASTSHSAQGATVDRVIIDIDTQLSPELVNRKQFYVSISRARNGISIFTDDRSQLMRAVSRSREKSMAVSHELALPKLSYQIVPDEPRHVLGRGHGMRR